MKETQCYPLREQQIRDHRHNTFNSDSYWQNRWCHLSVEFLFYQTYLSLILLQGYTGIVSWTAVEPAVEVLSVSLPVMAPFLHARRVLREIRTSLQSFFFTSRRSKGDTSIDGAFHNIDSPTKRLNPKYNEYKTVARAGTKTPDGPADIPLHSIMVTDGFEVRWVDKKEYLVNRGYPWLLHLGCRCIKLRDVGSSI